MRVCVFAALLPYDTLESNVGSSVIILVKILVIIIVIIIPGL